ncbi:class A beta-lactamase-related serine hydrolase [Mammaliicoccus vitulinus]|uniref:serine hydrolase domain-containing protein n=1 Tax=Mammaliicoccus vitulinus TaxID=71237 RepID=UPI000E6A7A20|nr:serine hydrolase domain-containing protein [Mammaliicoccus vitulinus]RIN13975.1 class A beta-lactamase-related serine hydrolase [Mammaliicoccus vitulinus]
MKRSYKYLICILVVFVIIFGIAQLKNLHDKKDTITKENKQSYKGQKPKNKQDIDKPNTKSFSKSKDIDRYLKKRNFNGNITVYKDNKLVMSNSYGYRDFENGIKNDSKSMYLIGSANKFITGLMLRQLEEKGIINLNDNVNKYIPNFQNKYPITIKDLMLHRSGLAKTNLIPYYYGLDGAIESIKLRGVVLNRYHQYNYNDANYITIAKVIENATKKSFEENLNELIIKKAHLKYTARYTSAKHSKYMVNGYKSIKNQYIYTQPKNLDKYDGAGNIYISTDDMAKLINKFKSGQMLSSSSTANLLSTGNNNIYPSSYRYGFYSYLNYQRYRGVFYQNDIISYSNNRYIVSIASNKLSEPYQQETEKSLKYIYINILKQQLT